MKRIKAGFWLFVLSHADGLVLSHADGLVLSRLTNRETVTRPRIKPEGVHILETL